ncbi:hypothetical protein [Streptomyces sp. NRRL S-1448]|uniref:hypothetical protein n=1 Tax=Streptomyces sp. NRRL S-1448 TaxID=1463883 RepID=UPI0004C1DBAE|nr:hypothetical protein [Streptomyces sp. NRRL S-1448]
MRKSMDRTGRRPVCAPAASAWPAALSSAAAAPALPRESARLPFAARCPVTRHGQIARAAGSSIARQPAGRSTLGPDSEVFGLRPALRSGGDRLTFRFSPHRPGYLLGALFVQTETRR